MDNFINLVVFFPFFLIAIMFHEVAHGYAALRAGDDTAKHSGRLTLNPIAHIDPVGLVFFIISAMAGVGFGWAKPVPVNPARFRNFKRDFIVVSIAGVAANLALIIFTVFAIKLLLMTGVLELGADGSIYGESAAAQYIQMVVMRFIALNGILIVFNLIPIPPLDGSKVLMMLLPPRQAVALARIEPFGFLILLAGLWFGVFDIFFRGALYAVMSFAHYIFIL